MRVRARRLVVAVVLAVAAVTYLGPSNDELAGPEKADASVGDVIRTARAWWREHEEARVLVKLIRREAMTEAKAWRSTQGVYCPSYFRYPGGPCGVRGWVATDPGCVLNVRGSPSSRDSVRVQLPRGTAVGIGCITNNGYWAKLIWPHPFVLSGFAVAGLIYRTQSVRYCGY
jgi:hypothetical protein